MGKQVVLIMRGSRNEGENEDKKLEDGQLV